MNTFKEKPAIPDKSNIFAEKNVLLHAMLYCQKIVEIIIEGDL